MPIRPSFRSSDQCCRYGTATVQLFVLAIRASAAPRSCGSYSRESWSGGRPAIELCTASAVIARIVSRVTWLEGELIVSRRLRLEPLTVTHATEMVDVLGFLSIYEFIGGEPPSLNQLHRQYTLQSVGHSDDSAQGWLNWVVRRSDTELAIGFVQATLERDPAGTTADIALVIAPPHQQRGYASEASTAMAHWLQEHGVNRLVAYVHPRHQASANVAQRLRLHVTHIENDGEIRWES